MTDARGVHVASQAHRDMHGLKTEFAGIFSSDEIEECVDDSLRALAAGHPDLPQFLPALVHRLARERLLARAHARGAIVCALPQVLFLCIENAGRSQMAAALTEHLGRGLVQVRSAGSAPAETINPRVREAMHELGIDVSRSFPKPLTNEFVQAADVVVTMGCGDTCPVFPGKRYVDWDVDDPSGQSIEVVRQIRDDIARRVRQLLTNLGVDPR